MQIRIQETMTNVGVDLRISLVICIVGIKAEVD